jgi:hypothetical protein
MAEHILAVNRLFNNRVVGDCLGGMTARKAPEKNYDRPVFLPGVLSILTNRSTILRYSPEQ